jgi:hypothetical protein
MLGAAWATIVAFFVQMVLINAISQQHYAIPYEYGRLVKLTLVMGGIYLLSMQISPSDTLATTLTLKAALLLACPFLLMLLGFFQHEELASLTGIIRTVRGRFGFVG